jgi:hypothetical protein
MDEPMAPHHLCHDDFELSLPMPLFLVVEDVGWWQGRDGSSRGEPYRTGMGRRHCLADYQALATLAARLSMRIQLSMVLCEWDRTDLLRQVPTATWMGREWDNSANRGPWLEEAAAFLHQHDEELEIGLHALGHEYWDHGHLQRSEFHNEAGIMRPPEVINQHLEAFGELLRQNGLGPFPQSFVPPALYHSFGNHDESMQAILNRFGIRFLTTIFSRARQYAPPRHESLTWECGVLLIERNEAAVPWHLIAAPPPEELNGPIVSLHWANLLHPDPTQNETVIEPWAERLLTKASAFDTFLAPDTAACWTQYAYCSLAKVRLHGPGLEIDARRLPDLDTLSGPLYLKVRDQKDRPWQAWGGKIVSCQEQDDGTTLLAIRPHKGEKLFYVSPRSDTASS